MNQNKPINTPTKPVNQPVNVKAVPRPSNPTVIQNTKPVNSPTPTPGTKPTQPVNLTITKPINRTLKPISPALKKQLEKNKARSQAPVLMHVSKYIYLYSSLAVWSAIILVVGLLIAAGLKLI